MGIFDSFRAQQIRRDEEFRSPGGPDADEKMNEIAKQDPYGLENETVARSSGS